MIKLKTSDGPDKFHMAMEKKLDIEDSKQLDFAGEKIEVLTRSNGKYVYRINGDSSDSAEYESASEATKAAKADIAVSKGLK